VSQGFIELVRRGSTKEIAEWVEDDPEIATSRDARGVSALMWAIYSGQTLVREFLLSGLPDLDLAEAAAVGNCVRLAALLKVDPAKAKSTSPDGWPLLHLAAAFGTPEAVSLLLLNGADVHQIADTPMRNQALHAALALAREPDTVRMLLQHGADPNSPQMGGFRPLHQAAAAGRLDLVRQLLDAGGDPALLCDRGKSAADYARERSHPSVVGLLESWASLHPSSPGTASP
jgi:ankyrin repeat protein